MKRKPKISKRKFYKTVITIEVLSEEPIEPGTDLETIAHECKEGDWSLGYVNEKETILNGKQAAKALLNQASDPSFFQLNAKGEDIEDYIDCI